VQKVIKKYTPGSFALPGVILIGILMLLNS